MERRRLFVDMDGTLAVFRPVRTLETLYEPGYFRNLEPIPNVLEAVKVIIREHPEIEVKILSSVLSDSYYAEKEKNEWLDQYLPEIPKENRIFPRCGDDKKTAVPGGVRRTDYLMDYYTKNLLTWEPPAIGIKLLNGINHTNGTWKGSCITSFRNPQSLAESIMAVMEGHPIRDPKVVSIGKAPCNEIDMEP